MSQSLVERGASPDLVYKSMKCSREIGDNKEIFRIIVLCPLSNRTMGFDNWGVVLIQFHSKTLTGQPRP